MEASEAVDAYLEGRISRRTLVRRLVAGGVSFGAAASYAQLVDPAFAQSTNGDWGPAAAHLFARTMIVQDNLSEVVSKKRVRIKVQSHRALPQATAHVSLLRPHNPHGWTDAIIGSDTFRFKGPNTETISIPLEYNPPHSVDALRPLHKAHLEVTVTAYTAGQHGVFCEMSDSATLKR